MVLLWNAACLISHCPLNWICKLVDLLALRADPLPCSCARTALRRRLTGDSNQHWLSTITQQLLRALPAADRTRADGREWSDVNMIY